MAGVTLHDPQRLSEFLVDLYAIREHQSFSTHLLSALQSLVPSDYISYNEIDSSQQSMVSAIHRPYHAQAAKLLGVFARHAGQHPVVSFWQRSGECDRSLKWTDFLSQREFQRLPLYREYFRPLGIRHQLAFALSVSPSLVHCIALNRSRHDFTRRERQVIDALRPHCARAFQNVRAFTRLHIALQSRDQIDERLRHGVIALTPRRKIIWASPKAHTYLTDYLGGESKTNHLPERLARWLTAQDGREGSPFTIEGHKGTLTVRLLVDGRHRFLLLDERGVTPGNHAFLRLGLTKREMEVLEWVAKGQSNSDIAAILGVRGRTVAKHLERTFQVLGVDTRTAAAVKVHQMMRRKTDPR